MAHGAVEVGGGTARPGRHVGMRPSLASVDACGAWPRPRRTRAGIARMTPRGPCAVHGPTVHGRLCGSGGHFPLVSRGPLWIEDDFSVVSRGLCRAIMDQGTIGWFSIHSRSDPTARECGSLDLKAGKLDRA